MTYKTIKQLEKEIERIVRESKYKMGMSHIDSRKIKELEAQISQTKSICEMIEKEECSAQDNAVWFKVKILTKIKGDEK